MSDEQLPKLRPVNPRWLQFEGQRLLHIQDPLGLSDKTIIVPHSVAPLLGLLDGARNLDEVRAAFLLRSSAYLTPTQIEALIDNLDQALLLDNRRFRNALQEAVDAYRSGPSGSLPSPEEPMKKTPTPCWKLSTATVTPQNPRPRQTPAPW